MKKSEWSHARIAYFKTTLVSQHTVRISIAVSLPSMRTREDILVLGMQALSNLEHRYLIPRYLIIEKKKKKERKNIKRTPPHSQLTA